MITRIAVGSDGSAHAQHAVEFAAELAAQLHAEVTLVYAIPPYTALTAAAAGTIGYLPPDAAPEDPAVVRTRVEAEYAKPLSNAGVIWDCQVAEGRPADVIVQVAERTGAQLILVGTRSLHGFGEIFLGSTSHALAQNSAIPVVVVPLEHRVSGNGHARKPRVHVTSGPG